MSCPQREFLCKVLVVGDLGVGKTSIIQRYVHNIYSQCYRATIGVDFALKILHWDQDTVVRLQLWDIAGQERFGHMTRLYYREAVGALVVCDLGREATLQSVERWKEDLDSKVSLQNGKPIPVILLGNKCDQLPPGSGTKNLEDLGKELGFSGCRLTSAKGGKVRAADYVTVNPVGCLHLKEMCHNNWGLEAGPGTPRKDHLFLPEQRPENRNIDEAVSCLIKEIIANDEDSVPTCDPNTVQPSLRPLNISHCKGCSLCARW